MKKNLFLLVIILLFGIQNTVQSQDGKLDFFRFKNISMAGTVLDEQRKPVENVKLDLELAPITELKRELNLSADRLNGVLKMLKDRVGDGVYVTVETDINGKYLIKGIPIPGSYYLILRNNKKYFPTRLKVFFDRNGNGNKEFNAPNLIIRKRLNNTVLFSEEVKKEINESKKYYSNKEYKLAIKHLEIALSIAPEYLEGLNNLGIMYMADKDKKSAMKCFEKYINQKIIKNSLNKKDALLCKNIASYNYMKKNIDKAIIFYLMAIELNKNIGEDTYMYLGNSYLFNKDKNNAIKYYKKYIKLYPKASNIKKIEAILKKLEV